jgi:hypothetical protein
VSLMLTVSNARFRGRCWSQIEILKNPAQMQRGSSFEKHMDAKAHLSVGSGYLSKPQSQYLSSQPQLRHSINHSSVEGS